MPEESSRRPTGSSADTRLYQRPGMLTVIAPPQEAGRSVAVDPRGTVVGRDAGCDLVLSSDRISRRHAMVRIRDGEYEVEDLGSKNGTLLNGDPVTGARRLYEGDRLALADVEIELRLAGTAGAARRSWPPAGATWQPDRATEVSGTARDRPDQHPRRSLRRDLQEAPGFSAKALLLAVAGSVVGTVLTGAAGTGPWGTLAGAAVLPLVSTAFSTKRTGENGRVRAAAIVLLSLGALVITWTGVSLADLAAGKSVIPGSDERPSTFPGLTTDDRDPRTTVTDPPTPNPGPVVEVSPVDCGTVTVGSSVGCRRPAVITYNGTGRLHITSIEVVGERPGDFTADQTCVGEWLTPAKRTCQLRVTFQPSSAGQRSATLVVHQNLPPPDKGTSAALVGIGGPTGGDACLRGFMWREAFPGDHVCVTPETRAQARQDNQLADSRRSPTGGAFGVDTCLPGFVWREASPGDHVCVTPETRAQTRQDNQLAESRRAG